MWRSLKILSLAILLFSGKTPGNTFGNEPVSITCNAELPASNLSVTYDIIQNDSAATNNAFGYCLKVPVLVSILTFSVAVIMYLGIYDVAIAWLPTILEFIELDKVVAALFMISMAYLLKEPVLTAIPLGSQILLRIKTAEYFFTLGISHTISGIVFLFDVAGNIIEFSLDYALKSGWNISIVLLNRLFGSKTSEHYVRDKKSVSLVATGLEGRS